MFCKNCGRELEKLFNICPYCKSDLSEDTMNLLYKEQQAYDRKRKEQQKVLTGNNRLTLPLITLIASGIACYVLLTSTLLEFNYMRGAFFTALVTSIVSFICLISREYNKDLSIISLILSIISLYLYWYNYNRLLNIANDFQSFFEKIF